MTHVIKTIGTFNGQVIETYQSKAQTSGAKGGDGGKGGIHGLGGNYGKVKLFGIENIRIINNKGNDGIDGVSGEPGKGGKNGDAIQGIYINEMLFPVFREKGKEFDGESIAESAVTTATNTAVVVGTHTFMMSSVEATKALTIKTAQQTAKKAYMKLMMDALMLRGGKPYPVVMA